MPKPKLTPAAPGAGDLKIEWLEIGRIRPYPNNARVITRAAISKVAASIKQFGWQSPIVVDRDFVIIIGHVRRLAALKNHYKTVPVHVADLPPDRVKALRLADNRTHEETDWSRDSLIDELGELDALNLDLNALTGFDDDELDKILDDPLAKELAGLLGGKRRKSKAGKNGAAPDRFSVLVTCADEVQRSQLLERLSGEGLKCRVWQPLA
jgi:hypothetical protein